MVLQDCLYVPSVRRNLISVSSLVCNGFLALFNKKIVFVKWNDDVIYCEMLVDNLYLLKQKTLMQINSYESNLKRKKSSSMNKAQLWHLRLGHINLDKIHSLVTCGYLNPLDVNALPVCESCLKGKMTMRPFKAKGHRAKEVFDLVQSDLCGPINTSARGGYKYFITFIGDYSRYGYIYLMHHKSKAFEKFKEYKTEVENHRGKSIKSL